METVADKDLYLWHFYIGVSGTMNDLNVMAFSPFNSMTSGSFPPPISYTVNGVERTLPYVLCDGIYPKWAVLINTSDGESAKEKYFASFQEGRRKDAEHVYAYLFQDWSILEQPARFLRAETLVQVGTCCAILKTINTARFRRVGTLVQVGTSWAIINNMIVSHRRKEPTVPQPDVWGAALPTFFVSHLVFFDFLRFLALTHMFPAPEN